MSIAENEPRRNFKIGNSFKKMSKYLLSFISGSSSSGSRPGSTNDRIAAIKQTANQVTDAHVKFADRRGERDLSQIANRLPSLATLSAESSSGSRSLMRKPFSVLPGVPTNHSSPSSSNHSPVTSTTSSTSSGGKLCCDKCDGKHETSDCPYYRKERENHPDAQKNARRLGGASTLPGATLMSARVVRQPGDGSCLFHSLSYGLKDGSTASRLRPELCAFIRSNGSLLISDTPLRDWVKWDSGSTVADYASRMSHGTWGGGIEMACFSKLKGVNVHVYERSGMGYFKRISAFDCEESPEKKKIVRVLYCGGVHYDALVV